MNDVIFFGLLSLTTGALFAMLAIGLVSSYKGSGVINFAHGALAMYPAFTLSELTRTGDMKLPIVDVLPTSQLNLPVTLAFTDGPTPFPLAFALSLGMAALLGVMSHYLVFRPLRNAPPLGKVVGSLGVLLYLQGVAVVNFGTVARSPADILPSDPIEGFLWFDRPIPEVTLWLSGTAILVGLVVWFLYQRTRFGAATRAAASNEKGALLLGYSPDRLALANWVLASVVAGLAGMLVSPVTGLDPARFTLFVVPALGAALLGRLTSIPIAVAAGLGLGAVQGIVSHWSTEEWFPGWARTGAITAVPLLVIVFVLMWRGDRLPIRGTVAQQALPASPKPVRVWQHALIWPAAVLLLSSGLTIGGVTLVPDLTGTWQYGLTASLILALYALSYVVLTGYVGQISLVQMALAGTGAFVTVRLLSHGQPLQGGTATAVDGPGLPLEIAAPIGVLVAVLIGMLVGLPALRIRGVQLAVATIAAALVLQDFYFKNPELTDLRSGGGAPVPPPRLFGMDLSVVGDDGLSDSFRFTAFAVVVLALACVAVANLRRGGTGRRFLAVRANERAAAAAGIDVARTKLLAFAVASAIAGTAGVMTAFQQATVSYQNFELLLGLSVLSFAYLGGITSINGSIVAGLMGAGGFAIIFVRFHVGDIEDYMSVVGGVALINTAIVHPEGIAPVFQRIVQGVGRFLLHARWPEWRAALAQVAPVLLGGAAGGWLLWARHDEYSGWMVLLGIYVAVIGRVVGGLLVRRLRSTIQHVRPGASDLSLTANDGPVLAVRPDVRLSKEDA